MTNEDKISKYIDQVDAPGFELCYEKYVVKVNCFL